MPSFEEAIVIIILGIATGLGESLVRKIGSKLKDWLDDDPPSS